MPRTSALGWPERLESGARWAVPVVIAAIAVNGVYASIGLFADGSYSMLGMLQRGGYFVYDPARWYADIVTQTPVVLAIHLGVNDVATLIRTQSLGLVAIPLAAWVGALAAQWKRHFYWAIVVMFAVTELNTGFVAIGEFSFAYSLVALSSALLLRRDRMKWWQAVTLVLVASALVRSYEALAYLGPILLALAIVRLVGVREKSRSTRWVVRVVLALAAYAYATATVIAVLAIRSPRDPSNARDAADLWGPLQHNRQFVISAAVAVMIACVPLIRRVRFGSLLSCVLAVAAAALLLPQLWAQPSLHYATRTLAGVALFGLLSAVVGVDYIRQRRSRTGRAETGSAPLAWVAPFALFCALVVPFTVHTFGFAGWVSNFEQVVVTNSGTIPLAKSGLDAKATDLYGWGWTNPSLSILLQEHSDQAIILSPAGNPAATVEELPSPLPVRLPEFTKTSPLFP